MPSPEFEKFYQTLQSQKPRANLSILELRNAFEQMMQAFSGISDLKITPVELKHCSGVWMEPSQITTDKVMLFLHGGGYVVGSWQSHQDLMGRIAKGSGMRIFAINYRLAPEHPFPDALNDTLEAYDYLLSDHFSSKQIIVSGTSAGGGLALAVILKLKELNKPLPAAGILLCPWVDLAFTGETLKTHDGKDLIRSEGAAASAKAYIRSHNAKDPYISPLYGDLSHLPPLLIQAGTIEIFWSEIEALVHKATESGTHVTFDPHEGMFHTWQLFASKIPEGQKAIDSICHYINHL